LVDAHSEGTRGASRQSSAISHQEKQLDEMDGKSCVWVDTELGIKMCPRAL